MANYDDMKPNDHPMFDDCATCDCYVTDQDQFPFCPVCAQMPLEQRKALFVEWAERLRTAPNP